MSQTSTAPAPTGSSAPGPRRGERAGRLPNWSPWAAFLGAAVVVGALWPVFDLNIALFVLYTVVLGTLAVYLLTRTVEGPRRATDRLVTCLVVSAFGLAMVPLVSLVWEVVSRAAPTTRSWAR
jgi:phosphate transport system permease protein